MRFWYRRWLWIVLGGGFACLVVGCALLLSPPVQGWFVRRLVASQPGWKVDFERIGVGLTGADATGLTFSMPGVEASSAPIAVRVALSQLFSRRELRIERVDAHKLRLVVTPAQLPASPPFDGLLKLLQSPLPWALDAASVTGEIDLRSETETQLKGSFNVSGGGVSSNAPGEFSYELSLGSPLLTAEGEFVLRSTGKVRMTQDNTQGVARLTLDGDFRLPDFGQGALPDGNLFIEVVASPTGETYQARLTFGADTVLQIEASLDAARTELTGSAAFRVSRSLMAQLSPRPLPVAQADGKIDFRLNFATSDLDTMIESRFDVRAWQTLLPQLALVDALQGSLTAEMQRRAGKLSVPRFALSVKGEHTPAEASVVLTGPIDPQALPERALARITFAHWPGAWAHPLLGSAELAGTWVVALDKARVVHVTAEQPLTLGPLTFPVDSFAPLSPATLTFSPRLDLSRDWQELSFSDLQLTTPTGDSLTATVSVIREAKTGNTALKGSARAELPAFLTVKASHLPLVADVAFESQLEADGTQLRLSVFELTVHPPANRDLPAYLAVQLKRPLTFDLAKLAPPRTSAADVDEWMRVSVQQLPLGWLSRWTPDREISGTLRTGEFSLSSNNEGGVALRTLTPWCLDEVSVSNNGVNQFSGNATVRMGGAWTGSRVTGVFDEVSLDHVSGNQVTGQMAFLVDLAAKTGRAVVSLDADILSVPDEFKAIAPFRVNLRTDVQSVTERMLGATEFSLEIHNATGAVLSAKTSEPVVFGLSENDMIVASTAAPLPIRLGAIPLEWLRPWMGEMALTGTLAPSTFELISKVSLHTLRAVSPLVVDDVGVRRGDLEMARHVKVSVAPTVELTLLGHLVPKFEMAYSGSLRLADVLVEAEGERVLDVDATLGFKGNDQLILGDMIHLTSRLDFASAASIPAATVFNLPPHGTLVTRVDGELLGAEPVEFSTRLSGVQDPAGDSELPPLELKLRGKISRDDVFTGGAELLLAATPQPSDAAFDVKVNMVDGNLAITSGLRSRFFDAGALLDVARVFGGKGAPRVASAAPVSALPASPDASRSVAAKGASRGDSGPGWGPLRGSFDLEIGAVQWGHYRIDRVTGRLDAGDQSLSLHHLGGEMFAGRWGGDLNVYYDPENAVNSHRLRGEFHIEQFESARVIQTVFPNQIASFEAELHLRASVSGQGNSLAALVDRSESRFTLASDSGFVRLAVPKADRFATAAVFGGTVLLSPELRALGRLLRTFAEMPVDQLTISGRRNAAGEINLDQFRFDSSQIRLLGHGRVAVLDKEPLANRPLELSLQLSAKDDLAVILGGMKLLERNPSPNGFRDMRQPVLLGGRAGEPDTSPLYDLLAKAVSGSRGTWRFLMRKVQAEATRKPALAPVP